MGISKAANSTVESSSENPSKNVGYYYCCWYIRIYCSFHFIIGIHHLLWSIFVGNYGKLELWRFRLPGVYVGTMFAAILLLYMSISLLFMSFSSSSPSTVSTTTATNSILQRVCYRKSIIDTSTCATFISFVVFLTANAFGIDLSYETERIWWGITMYLVPVILVVGIINEPSNITTKSMTHRQ